MSFVACEYGHDCLVELLLNNGAGVNQVNEEVYEEGQDLLLLLVNGHENIVQLLLNNGSEVDLYYVTRYDNSV